MYNIARSCDTHSNQMSTRASFHVVKLRRRQDAKELEKDNEGRNVEQRRADNLQEGDKDRTDRRQAQASERDDNSKDGDGATRSERVEILLQHLLDGEQV